MALRISHGSVLARRLGNSLALPSSTDAAIEVHASVELDAEAGPATRALSGVVLTGTLKAPAPDAPQRTRAVEAYTRVQAGLHGVGVGHYLRVLA